MGEVTKFQIPRIHVLHSYLQEGEKERHRAIYCDFAIVRLIYYTRARFGCIIKLQFISIFKLIFLKTLFIYSNICTT